MQNHYNLIYREEEREMNPLCASEGIGLIPWSPLARGVLSGNRTKEEVLKGEGGSSVRVSTDSFTQTLYSKTVDNDFEIIDRVKELAAKKNVKPAQIALAWLMHKPNVAAPIVGATKMEHLEDAVEAVHITLTPEEMKYLEELYRPHAISGHSN
jgi:aryl-alcohol dehydrogenase (NADP+)